MKTKLLLLFLLGFTISNLNGQNVQMQGSTFNPSTPTDCSDLTYTLNYQTFCAGYTINNRTNAIVGNVLTISYYFDSPGPICAGVIGNVFDPYNLGMIPQGNYNVVYDLYIDLIFTGTMSGGNITVISCCGTDASFTSNKTVGCTDDTDNFNFTNTSTGATSNQWYLNGFPVSTATDFFIPGNVIGSYEVSLVTSDGTCTDSTSQTFNVFQSPTIMLGNDTTSCVGDNVDIIAPTGFSTYSWTNNTSTSNTATVSSTNTYTVTAIDANGCGANDDILVTFNALPTFSLGADTSICAGESLTLDPGMFVSYDWNTSATSQSITVNTTSNYSVEVTDINGCKFTDAIGVLVTNPPMVNLGQDTFEVCAGNSVPLNAGNFASYSWSTGQNSNPINVSAEGVVSVIVTDFNNCTATDQTYVKVNALPLVNFGGASLGYCEGSSVTLNPGTFNSYVWNTTDVSSTLTVNSVGTYSVTVTDSNNCSNSGSVSVVENANPTIDLGVDQDLCSTDMLTLEGGNFASYLWTDGSSNSTFDVVGADYSLGNNSFALTATDDNGCSGSDEIVINIKTCDVGISSVELENNISIFPNPVQDVINIQIDENLVSDIKIYNFLGKEVKSINDQTLTSNSSIDVSEMNEGLYFIEITLDNQRLVNQFLIKR